MGQELIRRMLRNYRSMSPSRFHALNQRISKALTNNDKIPESTYATNPSLLPKYLSTSEKYDAAYHQALYCSKLDIAQRDLLQAQLVSYLDEIALLLEATAVRVPDILLTTGFDLGKDRRGRPRSKGQVTDSEEVSASEVQEQG